MGCARARTCLEDTDDQLYDYTVTRQKRRTPPAGQLVNLNSGNRIGELATEEEALRDVQVVKQRRGPKDIAAIALAHADDQGNLTIIAEGDELVHLAERASAIVA
jgi:hypothetical protein